MADTTPEKVKAIAQHLEALDDSTIDIYIEDAQDELENTALEGNERAQRYLAAHYGTLNIRRVDSESVENVSTSYESMDTGEGLESTVYGQEFLRIARKENEYVLGLYS